VFEWRPLRLIESFNLTVLSQVSRGAMIACHFVLQHRWHTKREDISSLPPPAKDKGSWTYTAKSPLMKYRWILELPTQPCRSMIQQLQHNKRELSATACCPARIWNFIGVKFWTFETTFVLVFDQWQATERICDYYDGYIQWRSL